MWRQLPTLLLLPLLLPPATSSTSALWAEVQPVPLLLMLAFTQQHFVGAPASSRHQRHHAMLMFLARLVGADGAAAPQSHPCSCNMTCELYASDRH